MGALLWSDSRLLLEDEPEDGGAMVVEERQWQYAFASPDVDAVWYTLRLAVYQDVSRGDRDLSNAQVPSDEVLRALLQPRRTRRGGWTLSASAAHSLRRNAL